MGVSWRAKAKGNPFVMGFSFLMFTSGFYLSYNKLYLPYAKKQKMAQQEKFANILIDQEEKRSNTNENVLNA